MSYQPIWRVVLLIVLVLCLLFLTYPWKQVFVYPRKSEGGTFFALQSVAWIIALITFTLASFNIQRTKAALPRQGSSHHVLFLLDGSLSMSADDVTPNRFNRASKIIASLAEQSSEGEVTYGLIVFSWLPLIRVPRTRDARWFAEVLSWMSLGEFPASDGFLGTALGDALLLSLDQFSRISQKSTRSIVIISDGDSNKWYDPYNVLPLLQQQKIPVHFITIGEDGYEVGKDVLGVPVITFFDYNLIEDFTSETSWKLLQSPTDTELALFAEDLAKEQSEVSNVTYVTSLIRLNAFLLPVLTGSIFVLLTMHLYWLLRIRKRQ